MEGKRKQKDEMGGGRQGERKGAEKGWEEGKKGAKTGEPRGRGQKTERERGAFLLFSVLRKTVALHV